MMSAFLDAVQLTAAPGVIRGRGETMTGQRVELELTIMPLANRPNARKATACWASTRRSAVSPC
jgi:hypothetical protein